MNQELYDHISAGSYDTSDVPALTATLQAETVTTRRAVAIAEMSQYADQNGLSLKLIDANYDAALPVDGRKAVDFAQSLLKATYPDFSMESAIFLRGLQGLIYFNVFTQGDADGLLALSFEAKPRWPDLTENQVQVALNQDAIAVAVADERSAETALGRVRSRLMQLRTGRTLEQIEVGP